MFKKRIPEATEETLIRQFIRENVQRKLIYENISFSCSISLIIRKIREMGSKEYLNYGNNKIVIGFPLSKNNEDNYRKLNHFMDIQCGWKHSTTTKGRGITPEDKLDFMKNDFGKVFLQYEPKFDVEIGYNLKILYHLTPFDKLERMLKKGLSPRSSDNFFEFNNRIYFSKNIDPLYDLARRKFEIASPKSKKIKVFAILQVHPESRIRFFEDPNFPDGVYTMENIDRFSINPIEWFELDDEGNVAQKGNI